MSLNKYTILTLTTCPLVNLKSYNPLSMERLGWDEFKGPNNPLAALRSNHMFPDVPQICFKEVTGILLNTVKHNQPVNNLR